MLVILLLSLHVFWTFIKIFMLSLVPSRPRALTKVKVKRVVRPARGPGEKVNRLTSLGVATPGVGVAKRRRRQVWASPGRGVAMIGVGRLMCRCCHPLIPMGRKDRGRDDMLRGNGTGEEASGPGTS